MHGFGHGAFGHRPFGNTDWARVVLWDELDEETKQSDLKAGGWYYKFVTSMMPSFNQLRNLIYKSRAHLIDPRTARKDILEFLAGAFGVIPDLSEPENYQRMKVEMAGRWRLVKGTTESYKILCAIHGFSVEVYELWWDGANYTTEGPEVYNEVVGTVP